MQTRNQKEKETSKFSATVRARSFAHAGRGIKIFLKTTHNAWIQIVLAIGVISFGFIYHLNQIEWTLIVFAIGLVLVAEAFNSALEVDIDLTSPEYHPYARDSKDIAAGAVLIATITAIVIGCIIFIPKIF